MDSPEMKPAGECVEEEPVAFDVIFDLLMSLEHLTNATINTLKIAARALGLR